MEPEFTQIFLSTFVTFSFLLLSFIYQPKSNAYPIGSFSGLAESRKLETVIPATKYQINNYHKRLKHLMAVNECISPFPPSASDDAEQIGRAHV